MYVHINEIETHIHRVHLSFVVATGLSIILSKANTLLESNQKFNPLGVSWMRNLN